MAEGADAGPEPFHKEDDDWDPDSPGTPLQCHDCDQDPNLPLAGKGRCPCYECAVHLGKVEEWKKNHVKKN